MIYENKLLGTETEARHNQPADKAGQPSRRYFLSVRQVADRWNLSERTVWRFLKLKQIPTYRFGAARRILEADIKKFEDERLTGTG